MGNCTTLDKKIHLEGSGWVTDLLPSSYHAETLGNLTITRLLCHLSKFFDNPITFKPKWVCDNSSLVSQYGNHVTQQQNYNSTLAPDWDILHQLINSGQTTPLQAEWIRAHQDRKCSPHKLLFKAQLNCRSDKLVEYQHTREKPVDLNIVPPMEAIATQLLINDKTITSQYVRSI